MTARRRLPPLADTLGVLLPDAQDMLLLRACLGEAASAAAAWEAWLAMVPGLPTALVERPRSRRLLPLLYHALSTHGIALGEPSRAILRAATLWEERRATHIRAILIQVMACLRRVGAAPVLLKGVALAEAVYPQFRLRHCHDLDLLIESEALPAAREALLAAGFRPPVKVAAGRGRSSLALVLRHEGGLQVNLHTRLWAPNGHVEPLQAFRRRARAIEIDGERLSIFAPMDMLLHVCGHAGSGPGNWAWIADAAMILRRHAASTEDWAELVRTAAESGIAVSLAVRFADLGARFALAIPVDMLNALAEAAWRSSNSERDAAISAARAASGAPFFVMLSQSGWRSRFQIARWALRRSRRLVRTGSER